MKSFFIGIILFAVLIIGGILALSFMDIDVPQTTKTVTIETSVDAE